MEREITITNPDEDENRRFTWDVIILSVLMELVKSDRDASGGQYGTPGKYAFSTRRDTHSDTSELRVGN